MVSELAEIIPVSTDTIYNRGWSGEWPPRKPCASWELSVRIHLTTFEATAVDTMAKIENLLNGRERKQFFCKSDWMTKSFSPVKLVE